ncbi:hypothetical protein SXIM_51090 [Streptomyces xiamenensis]|uniref:Uncharacterized protein n=1 Tax=Streptomyces xiamenensis TaxID=408015 RepID=A0A0F7G026_9ACTN|nr:hypothetical protein SXIM_51090 [Streptomyces xiamenensis]
MQEGLHARRRRWIGLRLVRYRRGLDTHERGYQSSESLERSKKCRCSSPLRQSVWIAPIPQAR